MSCYPWVVVLLLLSLLTSKEATYRRKFRSVGYSSAAHQGSGTTWLTDSVLCKNVFTMAILNDTISALRPIIIIFTVLRQIDGCLFKSFAYWFVLVISLGIRAWDCQVTYNLTISDAFIFSFRGFLLCYSHRMRENGLSGVHRKVLEQLNGLLTMDMIDVACNIEIR